MGRRNVFGSTSVRGLLGLIVAALVSSAASAQSPASGLTLQQQRLAGVWLAEAPTTTLLTVEGEAPPLTPEADAVYRERIAARGAGETSFDAVTWCASPGMPRIMLSRHPFEIVVSDRQVAFLFEWYSWFRTVDMSGAPQEALFALKMGASAGRWDGDALVIATADLSDATMLDAAGLPRSEELTLTERLSLKSDDVLSVRFTIDDPATYTRPWEAEMTYRRQPEGSLGEYACLDRIAAGEPALLEE